jgi:hypothetical protein
MMDWSQFASPALLGLADSLIYRMGVGNIKVPMFNVAISNVPGVRVPLYWAGAKVLSNYPMSVTTDNMGIKLYPPDWSLDLSVIYARGTFPSLSMQDIAAQTYTSTGLLKSELALSTSFATNLVLEASIDSIAFTMPERDRA